MVVESIMLDKPNEKRVQKKCSVCGCQFIPVQTKTPAKAKTSVNRHRRLPKGGKPSKCSSCEARRSQPSTSRRLNRRFCPDPHSCTMCNKTFISSAHLILHLASHKKERKHGCGICGKLFHQAAHLMAHKTVHSSSRPFKCPECGKTFTRASHLKTHRRLHTGEKPYACTYCGKAFSQKAGLISHIHMHKGETVYKCERCGSAFPSLSLLQTHKEQELAEQAGSVSTPSQGSKQPGSLDDLKCGVCCRTFVRSSYIRLYVRVNKGQRPYHCKVCNKTFVKMDSFVNHCDKHLRHKKVKSEKAEEEDEEEEEEEEETIVKPPLFVPVSESSSLLPVSSEVNTRSRSRAKNKMEP